MTRFVTRRRAIAAAAILAVLLALLFVTFEISKAACWQLIGTPVCKVETDEKLIALTFDDGPTPLGVDAVLPVLERYGAHATFFLVGQEMEWHPGQAQRLVAAGHELGNHSFYHQRMWGLFPGSYEAEIRRTDALLRAAGQPNPHFFRPPNGKKLTGLPIAVARAGYTTVTWDYEDQMTGPSARAFADTTLARVKPGSIVVMHVMYKPGQVQRDALPLILEGLKARGYRVVTVGELLKHAR
ncbi:polysaccharide deacetylase family protein [Sphingomonas sp. LB-2]|uniref:polysaccharide deacetylase family protein n=1 Tax=Sphingomonas caeni TaxID=2984949 RepID=UPI002231B206|nr:polysaccharide deacetylase family protein [Sphingomonas caeni]MCW3849100.1 polysaccharide deacetylase family protein [Sphingomonas caeni]